MSTTIPYNVNEPGRKDFTVTDPEGIDVCVTAVPGWDLHLWCVCQSLPLDTEDVEPLIESIRAAVGERRDSMFESCLAPDRVVRVEIGNGANVGWLRISSNDGDAVTVAWPSLSEVVSMLIDAHDYATAGPCPNCEQSMAEHPCNGCAEPHDPAFEAATPTEPVRRTNQNEGPT